MWKYEKKLQYPVNIKKPDARMAQVIISQLGGPDGELSASLRYLNQRYSMPYSEVTGLLTDIGVSVSVYDILFDIVKGSVITTASEPFYFIKTL